jgi:hypothetical protein
MIQPQSHFRVSHPMIRTSLSQLGQVQPFQAGS